MEYRYLGNSELKVSAITFGAWAAGGWMWGSTDRNEAIQAIQASLDLGVSSIDTAPVYGQGTSEEIVAEAIAGHSRDKIQILTKFGMRWDVNQGELVGPSKDNSGKDITLYRLASKESIIYECEQSLKRLKTDYIDLYQIHWPDTTTPIEESFEAVAQLVKDGKIRYAGVCNYTAGQLVEAERVCPIISNQIPFSMVNRDNDLENIPFCQANNIGVLAYSPMERGLLTGKIKNGQQFAEGDHRATYKYFKPESIERTNAFLKKIKPIADEHGITLSQLVLRWTIDHPGITIALAGARNAEQAISNAHASDVKLSTEQIEQINRLIQSEL
ncbi:aldo/keto reductase [Sphingobacterium hungaricum]|uniref:Aldo/keto reductase n=1 Tax=Sphingobacterium hungaricum TaxID=2082723 RepID=A0A928UWV7_9SPHI|nr:aldo/keto reductase [Sphingobacterium hungaricum]MBE8714715.1 aldo/keto reductase [Sphingobacterium hungaricum]